MSVDLQFSKNGIRIIMYGSYEKVAEYLAESLNWAENWTPYEVDYLSRAIDRVCEDISEARKEQQKIRTALNAGVTLSGQDLLELVESQMFWKEQQDELIAVRASLETLLRIFNTSTWENDNELETRIEYKFC